MQSDAVDIYVYDQLVTEACKIGTGENTPQDFVDFFGRMFPSQYLSMIGWDNTRITQDIYAFSNFEPSGIDEYLAYYSTIHPYAEQLLKLPLMKLVKGTDFLSNEELYKTEFYNDFLLPNDNVSQTFGVSLFKEPDRFLLWSCNHTLKFKKEATHAASAMQLLAPHLRRSFELARRLELQDKISRTLENTLNALASPVFICKGNMDIQFSNAAAQKMLKSGNVISSRQNRLNFVSMQANIKIRAKVHAYARQDFSADSLNPNLFIPVELPLSPNHFAFVSALPDEENAQRSIFGTLFERPVMIMLINPAGNGNVRAEIVQNVFGVTKAEAVLACALAKGMSPNEFADERNVSRNTVRVQTQALLNKMGARRQSDITRMLATAFSGLELN